MRIADAYVGIVPDGADFRSQLRRIVETAVRAVKSEVDVGANVSRLKETIREATTGLTATVEVDADTTGLRREVAAAAKAARETVEVEVDADATGLRGEVTRAAAVAGAGQSITVPMRVDSDQAKSALAGLIGAFAGAKLASSLIKWPLITEGATAAAGSVMALSAGLVALTGALGPVVGVLPSLGAMGVAAAQGMGVVKLATSGLTDALKLGAAAASGDAAALAGLDEALKGMDPSARTLVLAIGSLRPQFEALRNVAQAGLFPGVTAAIRSMQPLFGTLTPIVGATAGALGALAERAGAMFGSATWRSDITTLGMANVGVISSLGTAGLGLANVFRGLFVAAIPLTSWMAEAIAGWVAMTGAQVAAARSSGALAAFFDRTRVVLSQLGAIVGNVGAALASTFQAARPLGEWILANIVALTARWREWSASVSGSNALTEFFASAQEPLAAMGRLLGAVAEAFGRIGTAALPGLGPLFDQIRTQFLPVLEQLLSKLDTAFLSSIVSAITELTRFFGVFSTATPLLTFIIQGFTGLLGGINQVISAVPGLSGLVGVLGTIAPIFAAIKIAAFVRNLLRIPSTFGIIKASAGGLKGVFTGLFGGLGPAKGLLAGIATGFKTLALAAVTAIRAIGAAMLANPWLLVIAAVIAAIALVIIHWDKVKVALIAIWNAIKAVAMTIWNAIKAVIETVIKAVVTVVTTYLGILVAFWTGVWNAILAVLSAVWGAITGIVGGAIAVVGGVIQGGLYAIWGVWDAAWGAISGVLSAVWGAITGIVGGAIAGVKGVIQGALDSIRGIWNTAWNALSGVVSGAIGGVIDVVSGIGGAVLGALGNVGSLLFDAGKKIIEGLINGIKSMIGAAKDAVGNVVDAVTGLWPFGSPAKEGPLSGSGWTRPGEQFMEGLVLGIKGRQNSVIAAARATMEAAAALGSEVPVGGRARIAAGPSGGGTGGLTLHQAIYPSAGMSEAELARRVNRELAWAWKGTG